MRVKGGTTLVVAAICVVLILIILWSMMSIRFLGTEQIENNVEIRMQTHVMGNALDAARLYMETALDYSTYQACYDVLKSGGWDSLTSERRYPGEETALWTAATVPGMQDFDHSLKSSIKSNLGLYTKTPYKFFSEYLVNLPAYEVTVSYNDFSPRMISVAALPASNLNIQKTQESGEYVRLEKEGLLWNDYETGCYDLFWKGSEAYQSANKMLEDMFASERWEEEVASLEGLDARLSGFGERAKAALEALYGEGPVKVTVISVKAGYQQVSASVTPSGTTYRLRYTLEVLARFEVPDDSKQFPVYDGSQVSMQPMKLVFVGKFAASQPSGG